VRVDPHHSTDLRLHERATWAAVCGRQKKSAAEAALERLDHDVVTLHAGEHRRNPERQEHQAGRNDAHRDPGREFVGVQKERPAFPPAKEALQGKLTLHDSRARVDQHIAPAKKKARPKPRREGTTCAVDVMPSYYDNQTTAPASVCSGRAGESSVAGHVDAVIGQNPSVL
jgi:hypothetical protein